MRTMFCPVCRQATFDPDDYENDVCIECGWEYNTWQVENSDQSDVNNISLAKYRQVYAAIVADNPHFSCRNGLDKALIQERTRCEY